MLLCRPPLPPSLASRTCETALRQQKGCTTHSCHVPCFLRSSAHTSFNGGRIFSPSHCRLCSAFQIFFFSPRSNLSCSFSFYTPQPLICIFLFFLFTPVFLYSLYCLQPAAPRSPSLLYLLLLHFPPLFPSSALCKISDPCRNGSYGPVEHL